MTRAATLQVRATVLGDPPPYAAVITKPKNGQHFKEIPVDVEGTCPPDSIVKIYSNEVFKGSAICSAMNEFSMQIDLFEGKNTLIAKIFNYAWVEGPESDKVVAFYDKPKSTPPISPSPSGKPVSQLFLDSDTLYSGFFIGEKIDWPAEIGGGVAPYAVSVDWGDGTSDVISLKKAGKFNISHIYKKAGDYRGSYTITLKASDSQGSKAFLQIVVIVNDFNTVGTTTGTGGDMDSLNFWQNLYNQILLLWPFYTVALLMLISFWLGERREINLLPQRRRGRRAH